MKHYVNKQSHGSDSILSATKSGGRTEPQRMPHVNRHRVVVPIPAVRYVRMKQDAQDTSG